MFWLRTRIYLNRPAAMRCVRCASSTELDAITEVPHLYLTEDILGYLTNMRDAAKMCRDWRRVCQDAETSARWAYPGNLSDRSLISLAGAPYPSRMSGNALSIQFRASGSAGAR